MKILMVCLGNICRSPLAEGVLQHKATVAGLNWEVDSAGVAGYHIGEAPHHLSQKVAKLNGVDISKQKARKFRPQDLHEFDKIYAMSNDVYGDILRYADNSTKTKVDLLLNEINPGKNEDLLDPWYGPESDYHLVYDLVDKACDIIIKKYSK